MEQSNAGLGGEAMPADWASMGDVTPEPKRQYTVQEFEAMCQRLADQRVVCAEKERLAKDEDHKCAEIESEILKALDSEGLKSYKGAAGTVFKDHRLSVKVPKSDEDRKAFFSHLQSKGIFDSMITVNSQTLVAWYKSEWESAKEAGKGLEFAVPGIGEPTFSDNLKFTKAK